jgi:two-component system, OmpR family, sensor histidine kinase ArlS
MPIRLRITLLFVLLVFIVLGIVGSGVYYFSYTARLKNIKTRLTNRAITTARLLSQREIFDQALVQRIDSLTTISLKHKVVQAYDHENRRIYDYADTRGVDFRVSTDILDDARVKGSVFFQQGSWEAVAYHYADNHTRIVVISAAEDTEAKQNLSTLLKILMLSLLVGIMLVLLFGYFFSGRLLRPIKKITEDVAEISAQNLARRIQTGETKDEWYSLSSTLNELLNRLQESFELQRRFISNASHELSTPLTSISSQLEVSLQRERDAESYRSVMKSIYQDVRHMSQLTQTLLEFAKASGNAGGLEINLIRIDEILLGLPSGISKVRPEYSMTLSFGNLPEDEDQLLVFGNETLLVTAIRNIVLNACKYSSDHRAEVQLDSDGQRLLVKISDNGIGIAQEDIEKIFQPFYRVDESRATKGFGLGLSLANRIIKLHHGNIDVQSSPTNGSTFTIELPSASAFQKI